MERLNWVSAGVPKLTEVDREPAAQSESCRIGRLEIDMKCLPPFFTLMGAIGPDKG